MGAPKGAVSGGRPGRGGTEAPGIEVLGAEALGAEGASPGLAGGLDGGVAAQPNKAPTIRILKNIVVRTRLMALIVLEALGALLLLVLIVWWTMFSGRKKGEPPDRDSQT